MGAIRGAICALNTVEDIEQKSLQLVKTIIEENNLSIEKIEAVFFSVTDDLNACYPAKSVREQLQLYNAAFMCFKEMSVPNSLPNCIRVCVLADGIEQKRCKHCYLGEAAMLRPDLNVSKR
ncbi:MAG: chorismate mutase [Clostridiales bacterium]|nr:chorismate mutase [Clostridiales bacterium]